MQMTLDILNEQVAALDRLSEEKQMPRDELVKLALAIYLSPERRPHPTDFF